MSLLPKESEDDRPISARVLIVDDAPGISDVLRMKLERDGYEAVIARTAASAAERLAAGDFDLILLDVLLPDGSGLDLLKQTRKRRSQLDTPIIVISGLDQTTDVVTALKHGANDYITKPFDLAVVVARIRTQLSLKRMKDANDNFLRIASHDLKKPLLIVLDVVRQLREKYPAGSVLDAEGRSALDFVVQSGELMQTVVTELLELGALRDQKLGITKRPTDFGAIVRQAVARNERYAKSKSGDIKMEFARDLPNIQADDTRIMQVLENLIGNAIKFSPARAITVVRTARDGDWIVCEVIDAGPGIPEKEMKLLFKEYARLSNAPTGGEKSTGLGLSISRELVLLHGGEIGARNNAEQGATFWFRLPIE